MNEESRMGNAGAVKTDDMWQSCSESCIICGTQPVCIRKGMFAPFLNREDVCG